jgi:hypothetical protein
MPSEAAERMAAILASESNYTPRQWAGLAAAGRLVGEPADALEGLCYDTGEEYGEAQAAVVEIARERAVGL